MDCYCKLSCEITFAIVSSGAGNALFGYISLVFLYCVGRPGFVYVASFKLIIIFSVT